MANGKLIQYNSKVFKVIRELEQEVFRDSPLPGSLPLGSRKNRPEKKEDIMMSHAKRKMKLAKPFTAIAVLALVLSGSMVAQNGPWDLTEADKLYTQGQFAEAALIYAQAAESDPAAYGAVLGLGRISLLGNKLEDAEKWLKKALALKAQEKEPRALIGKVLYRRNEYVKAAPFFEAIGQTAKAEKLMAFKDKTPFLIESGPDVSSLAFIQTDPLPIIKITVNGQEGRFLIDTGAWELHVLPAFAEKCGLKPLAQKEIGVYAGGRQAAASGAVADRVLLGEFSLRHVPVVLPQRAGSPLPIDGIVGTVVLYRFLFTLDYPGGRLVLRRNTPEQSKAVQAGSEKAGAFRMPFWLAGDHVIFARGTANGAGPYLFHVDSGMAGGGFSCPEYVVKEAKIELPKQGFQGMGGGGPITVYPFTVDLTLGEARQAGVRGLYGALPPGSEDRFGFRTGGIISHGFFRPFAVTFDFQTMTMYLQEPDRANGSEKK
ncbi:MAG: tetratricopeptide repeat protein [Chrysiogenales bacterium]|nr:MAG: tetratricopeptide repeat protein [Chrysiogenales bacterium]